MTGCLYGVDFVAFSGALLHDVTVHNQRTEANMHENRKDVKMAVSASDAISASGTGRVRTV